MGQMAVQDRESYQYLVDPSANSPIKKPQTMMGDQAFPRLLPKPGGGIAAIHRGVAL